MKNKIPCGVIRDLLPSYIENLTTAESNKEVEEHILECAECKKVLNEMKGQEEDYSTQVKEIDFLKKNRKRNKRIIVLSVISIVLAVAILVPTISNISVKQNTDYNVQGNADYNITVKDKILSFELNALTEDVSIKNIDFQSDGGKIYVTSHIVGTVSKWKNDYAETYIAERKIEEVYLDNELIWKDGIEILPVTSSLYDAYQLYIGAVGGNSELATVLKLNFFGSFKNQFHTSSKPYSWTIMYESEISPQREAFMKKYLTSAGYALLASVDNMDSVCFEYKVAENYRSSIQEKSLVVTEDEATDFIGYDIKTIGRDIIKLQNLLEKSGFIDCYKALYLDKFGAEFNSNVKCFYVENKINSNEVSYIAVNCIKSGELVSNIYLPITKDTNGLLMKVTLIPSDFGLASFDDMKDCSFAFVAFLNKEQNMEIYGFAGDNIVLSEHKNGTIYEAYDDEKSGIAYRVSESEYKHS